MEKERKQVALIILDGWGYREEEKDNAIKEAETPVFDSLWEKYPHTLLQASGEAVGLPEGQMGNSEVGHTTIGAGTIIDMDLVRITKAAKHGEFLTNRVIKKVFSHAKENNSAVHLTGLIGPGGVHSHSEHLFALLEAAKEFGVSKVYIHAFMDGRDTPPKSGSDYLADLEKVMADLRVGKVATVTGRYFAMDRDNNLDRTQKAASALFEGIGKKAENPLPSLEIKRWYEKEITDEHLEPIIFPDQSDKPITIKNSDSVFFFNFRPDRARQLSKVIMEKAEEMNLYFATMTSYDETFTCDAAFQPVKIETCLAAEISKAGLKQVHIAETEKFAHATYFLNGGKEEPFPGEDHVMIESRKDIKTHDEAPEMRASDIADKAIEFLELDIDFIFVNFANADMVGHTANVPAIVKGVEATDQALGKIIEKLKEKNGVAFITADHGNAEINIDPETGERHTAHTTSPVPAILTTEELKLKPGGLSDIAPTILELLNLPKPEVMTGKSLLLD